MVLSRNMATLYELQTVYSLEDLLDMVEVIAVNNFNEELACKRAAQKDSRNGYRG